MGEAKTIITEEAIEDYIRCPMRYAFIWHYGIDPTDSFSKFRSLLRDSLHQVYKCQYENRFSLKQIQEATVDIARTAGPAWPHLWGILLKHSTRLESKTVLAFSVPTVVRVGDYKFSGMVDLVTKDEKVLKLYHLQAYSPNTTDASADLLTDCVRAGFSQSVLHQADKMSLETNWSSMYLIGASLHFTPLKAQIDVRPFLASVGRGIAAQSFYPRGNAHTCRACCFRSICDTKWISLEKIRTPNVTREDIIKEFK